jgi:hypothetical protein
MGEAVGMHLLDEVTQHLFGDVEVGDDAVLERPDRGDRAWGAAQHPLRFDPDGVDLAVARVDRHHGGLRQHDAATAYVDERVGRAEVDRHVAAAKSIDAAEKTHVRLGIAAQSSQTLQGSRGEASQLHSNNRGASSASSPTGNPTTLETLPSSRATSVEPSVWIA